MYTVNELNELHTFFPVCILQRILNFKGENQRNEGCVKPPLYLLPVCHTYNERDRVTYVAQAGVELTSSCLSIPSAWVEYSYLQWGFYCVALEYGDDVND